MTDVSTYFNQVYEATFRTLMRACVCKARRLADADDLLQNTYARFYRCIQKHGVGSVQNPQSYLLGILQKELIAYYRLLPWSREVALDEISELPDPNESTESRCIRALTVDEVWKQIRSESELTQRVFLLYYAYGLHLKEIATVLHLTEAAVKNRLLRTQRKIRKQLIEEEK